MKTLIAVRDVPVWCGESRHEVRAILDAARLRERFPTTATLRTHLGLPPGDDAEWDALTLTRFDHGRPVETETVRVTPLGRIDARAATGD